MAEIACSDSGGEGDHDAIRRKVEMNPLMAAPAALRQPVWRLWVCHQHLFPSPLPLAGAVAVWVREHGLREEDAAAILSGFMSPTRMAAFRFASDLLTAMAEAATAAVRRRKVEAEAVSRVAADAIGSLSASEIQEFMRQQMRNFAD